MDHYTGMRFVLLSWPCLHLPLGLAHTKLHMMELLLNIFNALRYTAYMASDSDISSMSLWSLHCARYQEVVSLD